MASDDWYRNRTWDPEIEAAFDKRLGRSRSHKAQYLRIQGSMLKDEHPEVAIRLLKRCIDEGDDFHIAHALLDTAHAKLILGDVDAALGTLEDLLVQEERHPRVRTTAPYDYSFLVALHGRTERYQRAIELLDRRGPGFFESMIFEAEAAKAIIFEDQGERIAAREAAKRALDAASVRVGWVPGYPDIGLVPESPHPLRNHLVRIAGAA